MKSESVSPSNLWMRIIRGGVRLLTWYGWAPLVVFAVHCAASASGLYDRFPPIDIPMHFAGGFVIAFFLAGALENFSREGLIEKPAGVVRFVLLLALTMAVTVLWEFAEWTLDAFNGNHEIQISINNIMRDQLMGALGGLTFLATSAAFRKFLKKNA